LAKCGPEIAGRGGECQIELAFPCSGCIPKKDENRQAPLIYAAELGPLAMPLLPQIQELLNSQDASIRQLAGKALRRIDPKALPPLNER